MLDLSESIRKIQDGDVDAFIAIVREYNPMIRSYLAAQIEAPSQVDDLTQQTFIAAYEALASATFRGESGFAAWLRGIARNKLRMHFRSSSRRSRALQRYREAVCDSIADDLDACYAGDHQHACRRLRDCVGRLPARMQQAVRAYYFDELSREAVASMLELKPNAVSALLFRARKNLKVCLAGGAQG